MRLEDLQQLTLLTASLKRCIEIEEAMETAFRKPATVALRNKYRRIGFLVMRYLARQETATVEQCVGTLKLMLMTETKVDEHELLLRLTHVLTQLIIANWDDVVLKHVGRPQLLRLLTDEPEEADKQAEPTQAPPEHRDAWRLASVLMRKCA